MNSGNKIANRFSSLVSWNCFLGHLLKFANDRGTTIHSVLFGGINHHQCKRRHRKNKEQFHRVTFASPTLVSTDVIRRNPVAPASGPLANVLLFECDSLWIRVTAGRTQSVTQSTTRCTAAAHMTLWFAFTMTLAT